MPFKLEIFRREIPRSWTGQIACSLHENRFLLATAGELLYIAVKNVS
jgi:hypothetical protein